MPEYSRKVETISEYFKMIKKKVQIISNDFTFKKKVQNIPIFNENSKLLKNRI